MRILTITWQGVVKVLSLAIEIIKIIANTKKVNSEQLTVNNVIQSKKDKDNENKR